MITIRVFGMPAPQGSQMLHKTDGTFAQVHGLAVKRDPIYIAWKSIRRRCCHESSQDYKHYGGRGITLHPEWQMFPEAFVAHVLRELGPRPSIDHSLDRIENNGNYEPGNLRWGSRIDQQNNKRTNHLITYRGETHTVQEWSRITGIKRGTIRWRHATGKSPDEIFSINDRRTR